MGTCKPLGLCQASCTTDADCAGDFICFLFKFATNSTTTSLLGGGAVRNGISASNASSASNGTASGAVPGCSGDNVPDTTWGVCAVSALDRMLNSQLPGNKSIANLKDALDTDGGHKD